MDMHATYGHSSANEELPEDDYEAYLLMKEEYERLKAERDNSGAYDSEGDAELAELRKMRDQYAAMLNGSNAIPEEDDDPYSEAQAELARAKAEYNALLSGTSAGSTYEEDETDEYQATMAQYRAMQAEYNALKRGGVPEQEEPMDEFTAAQAELERVRAEYASLTGQSAVPPGGSVRKFSENKKQY